MSEPGSGASDRIQLVTVDDHEIFRGGTAIALAAYEDLELVGGASTGYWRRRHSARRERRARETAGDRLQRVTLVRGLS